jgi:hypothetical protein
VKLEGPTTMGPGGGPIVELFPVGAVLFPVGAVLFPVGAVLFPVGAVLFPVGAVLFPVAGGFSPIGRLVSDGDVDGGDGSDCGDGVDGGDSDVGAWPVDGENGMFGLNCAKAILKELDIAAIPITIIVDIKMMPHVF